MALHFMRMTTIKRCRLVSGEAIRHTQSSLCASAENIHIAVIYIERDYYIIVQQACENKGVIKRLGLFFADLASDWLIPNKV